MSDSGRQMEDVTGATGRQVLDDIFEESRLLRSDLDGDVSPDQLASMALPKDPYIGFYSGSIEVDGDPHEDGETLVVASEQHERRYLLKRWNKRSTFKAYQQTPDSGEKLRLLNVYRIMTGSAVT